MRRASSVIDSVALVKRSMHLLMRAEVVLCIEILVTQMLVTEMLVTKILISEVLSPPQMLLGCSEMLLRRPQMMLRRSR